MKISVPFFSHPRVRPFAAIICIFLGSICGCLFPGLGPYLGPMGEFLISLFKMCALPLVITMVIESFYRLNQRADKGAFILRTFKVFVISAISCTVFGVSAAFLLSHKVTDNPELMSFISKRLAASPHLANEPTQSVIDFLMKSVPQNIFKSLSEGQIFSCLIFFAFLGSAIGRIPSEKKEKIYEAVSALKQALFWMLNLFTRFLPLAVFGLFAKLFSGLGTEAAPLLLELVSICLLPLLAFNILPWLTLWIFKRAKFKVIVKAVRGPLFVAFSTNSSMVALPGAMKSLVEHGLVEEWAAETVMPLSITFNSQGLILFYSFMATLAVSIYGSTFQPALFVMIGLGAMLQAICASGLPGIATLGTLAMIFGPMGIPVDLMVIILLGILPFMSPFMAMTNLLGFSWSALMVERRASFRAD